MLLLSTVIIETGKANEAESLAREALLKSKTLLGETNPPTAACLNALGCALRKDGKLPEAESAFRQELAIWQALHLASEQKGTAQSLLDAVLREQGKPGRAGLDQEMQQELDVGSDVRENAP